MRAVVLHEFGPPESLVAAEVPDPVPGTGQALIDVEIANITFVETQVRAGKAPNPAMAPRLPAILGNGVGGVVASVGEGVDPALVSSRVVTSTGGSGGYAERVAVDAAGLIPVPEELGLAEAVALLADGRTALALLRAAPVRSGETVLVEAAAGGVGSLLVQLARRAGARVVAAAGGGRKLALAADLGAGVTVDYTEPGWADRLRQRLGGVDLAFDGVGGEAGRAAFDLVRPGGRFYAFGMASGAFVRLPDGEADRRNVSVVRGVQVTPEEARALTRAALAEAVAGRLRPVIGQRFPLERAADAHAAIEARATVGKTLLPVSAAGRPALKRLSIAVMLSSGKTSPAEIGPRARHVEALGLDGLFVGDHLAAALPLLDSAITLATVAAVTERIRIGFGVMVLALRHPAWAAKQIATLQRLSGDRVVLGVGTGGAVHGSGAFEAVGVPYAERGRRTDAALEVLPGLISGKATQLASGASIRVGARGAYQLADQRLWPAVRARRQPADHRKPARAAERFAEYAEAGADHLVLGIVGDNWLRQCELIAQARALLD